MLKSIWTDKKERKKGMNRHKSEQEEKKEQCEMKMNEQKRKKNERMRLLASIYSSPVITLTIQTLKDGILNPGFQKDFLKKCGKTDATLSFNFRLALYLTELTLVNSSLSL